jgi:hypothetical protein
LGLGGKLKELCTLGCVGGTCVGHSFGNVVAELFNLFWMYCKNALLDQQPIIMIRQTEQLPKNMAIAAPDLIKSVPISSFLIRSTSLPMA